MSSINAQKMNQKVSPKTLTECATSKSSFIGNSGSELEEDNSRDEEAIMINDLV